MSNCLLPALRCLSSLLLCFIYLCVFFLLLCDICLVKSAKLPVALLCLSVRGINGRNGHSH